MVKSPHPDSAPVTAQPDLVAGLPTGSRQLVQIVAQQQKWVLYTLIAWLLLIPMVVILFLFAKFFFFHFPLPGHDPGLRSLITDVFMFSLLGVLAVALVLVPLMTVLLASSIYPLRLTLLVVPAALIPGIGLLTALVVSRDATRILRANGLRVRLLGANLREVNDWVNQ